MKKNRIALIVGIALIVAMAVGAFAQQIYTERKEVLSKLEMALEDSRTYEKELRVFELNGLGKEYEDLLVSSNNALEKTNFKKSKQLIEQWNTLYENLLVENKREAKRMVEDILAKEEEMNLLNRPKELEDIIERINDSMRSRDYSDIDNAYKDYNAFVEYMIATAENIDISIYQIDTSEYPLIRLFMEVTDEQGREVENLNKKMFQVNEFISGEYKLCTIEKLLRLDQNERLNVSLVADVSGSMEGEQIRRAKEAMNLFINAMQFSVDDKAELIKFSDGVELVQAFTNDSNSIKRGVSNLTLGNLTALYDALYAAVNRTATQNGAKIVVGFTDGMDNFSNSTPDNVIAVAKRYNIPVYIIGIGTGIETNDLRKITRETGGAYYSITNPQEMINIYNSIYRQHKRLYQVEYISEATDYETHNISIKSNTILYNGQSEYSFEPNILRAVSDEFKGDNIDSVIGKYLRNFVYDMNNNVYNKLREVVETNSPMERTQSKYVTRDIKENLQSYEITSKVQVDANTYKVSVTEIYDINSNTQPLHMLVQEASYELRKQSNGEWKVYDFTGPVKVVKKLNY